MKHVYKKWPFVILLLCLALGACKKGYLDVNKDPNRVTDDDITPELLFTQAAEAVGSFSVGARAFQSGAVNSLTFAFHWVGYIAPNGTFARDAQETSYNIDYSFGNRLWLTRYGTLHDLRLAERKGLVAGDTALAGASIVLSCKTFQEMVDIFGDIPYSQAFQSPQNSFPAYDKAQDIYKELALRLDTAIKYLSYPPNRNFAGADIVNKGDVSKWIKFANTIKLRLLIRQSEVSGFDPSAEIAKIKSTGGPLGSGETVSENPGYTNDVDKQSPFYAVYGYTPGGLKVKATTSENANLYIVNILLNAKDDRINRLFLPVSGKFVGNRYGDDQINLFTGSKSSYFGPGLIGTYPDGAKQDQQIITAHESLFFQAEAIARGWMPGDAKAVLEAAIKESFAYLGVHNADSASSAYIANNVAVQYANAGSSPRDKAKFIAYQKYIANTALDVLESWADIRRLDMLTDKSYISANVARISNTLPIRLLYPITEYSNNAKNVNSVGTIDAFKTKIFWQP